MNLSRRQRNFIRKNKNRYSAQKIAEVLGLEANEILDYLETKKQTIIDSNKQKGVGQTGSWYFKDLYVYIFLFVLIFGLYLNSLGNAFVSDDIGSLIKDPKMGSFTYAMTQSALGFMRPLVLFLIYSLAQTTPWPYRLVNIVFHVISSIFVYKIVTKTSNNKRLGFLSAILFAVHPILIESVGWVSGGTYSQYSMFLFISFNFYLNLDQKKIRDWFLSILFMLLAISTSEKATVFPIILFVYELASGSIRKNWKRLGLFFIFDFIWIGFYLSNLRSRVSTLATQYYVQQGVDNPLVQVPIAITSYLELIFWPQGLTIYHSEMLFSLTSYLIRAVVSLVFLLGILLCFKKNKYLFFWLSFFIISLLPTLTPLRVSWTVAERYVYFGTLGILVTIAYGFERLFKYSDFRHVVWFVFGLLIVALSTRTIVRNVDWKNEDNLWFATAKYSPSSPNNHNNLGDVYARQGDLPKAAEEFKIAIQLKPNYADAYHNLGITYQRMGQFDKAIASYQEAIRLSPILWQSYQNLSMVYFENGDYKTARDYIVRALEIDPNNPTLKQIYDKFNEDASKLGI